MVTLQIVKHGHPIALPIRAGRHDVLSLSFCGGALLEDSNKYLF